MEECARSRRWDHWSLPAWPRGSAHSFEMCLGSLSERARRSGEIRAGIHSAPSRGCSPEPPRRICAHGKKHTPFPGGPLHNPCFGLQGVLRPWSAALGRDAPGALPFQLVTNRIARGLSNEDKSGVGRGRTTCVSTAWSSYRAQRFRAPSQDLGQLVRLRSQYFQHARISLILLG